MQQLNDYAKIKAQGGPTTPSFRQLRQTTGSL